MKRLRTTSSSRRMRLRTAPQLAAHRWIFGLGFSEFGVVCVCVCFPRLPLGNFPAACVVLASYPAKKDTLDRFAQFFLSADSQLDETSPLARLFRPAYQIVKNAISSRAYLAAPILLSVQHRETYYLEISC